MTDSSVERGSRNPTRCTRVANPRVVEVPCACTHLTAHMRAHVEHARIEEPSTGNDVCDPVFCASGRQGSLLLW